MKRFFMSFLAICFPWLIFLIKDNPGGAVMALILQATLIGWIPASLWALRVLRNDTEPKPGNKEKSPKS